MSAAVALLVLVGGTLLIMRTLGIFRVSRIRAEWKIARLITGVVVLGLLLLVVTNVDLSHIVDSLVSDR